jgi:hypothetical protein
MNVFRDDTGLAVSPALWPAIQTALDDSRFLVLMASPAAAESAWVNREVEYWLDTKGPDSILPVLTEGEWNWDDEARNFDRDSTTAVPPALLGALEFEPFHLDLRWARAHAQPTHNSPLRTAGSETRSRPSPPLSVAFAKRTSKARTYASTIAHRDCGTF